MEINSEPIKSDICPPSWFADYVGGLVKNKADLLAAIENLSELGLNEVNKIVGGSVEDLEYEFLQTLFPSGSGNEEMAEVLRRKREDYLVTHPEKQIGKGAGEGIIGWDGRFCPKAQFDLLSDSEKIGVMVGPTCFHYMTTEGRMSSNPSDFWPKDMQP